MTSKDWHEKRAVIKFCCELGKTPPTTLERIQNNLRRIMFPVHLPSSGKSYWNEGQVSLQDDARSGRPSTNFRNFPVPKSKLQYNKFDSLRDTQYKLQKNNCQNRLIVLHGYIDNGFAGTNDVLNMHWSILKTLNDDTMYKMYIRDVVTLQFAAPLRRYMLSSNVCIFKSIHTNIIKLSKSVHEI